MERQRAGRGRGERRELVISRCAEPCSSAVTIHVFEFESIGVVQFVSKRMQLFYVQPPIFLYLKAMRIDAGFRWLPALLCDVVRRWTSALGASALSAPPGKTDLRIARPDGYSSTQFQ